MVFLVDVRWGQSSGDFIQHPYLVVHSLCRLMALSIYTLGIKGSFEKKNRCPYDSGTYSHSAEFRSPVASVVGPLEYLHAHNIELDPCQDGSLAYCFFRGGLHDLARPG